MRITWEAVTPPGPEVIVCAPCGFDRAGAQQQADALVAAGVLPPGVAVQAVDANGRGPGPGRAWSTASRCWAALLHP